VTDLSKLSDDDLMALYQKPAAPDLSQMSDADLMKAYGAAPQPQTGMMEDAAKSTASGLASATAGTLGMGGDFRSMLSAGTDALGSRLGAAPDRVQAFKDIMSKAAGMTGAGAILNNAPTSQQVKDSAPDPIVSPDYKPQSTVGEIGKKVAEFSPGALFGGGLGGLTRNVAAPAIGSWAGGKLTDGSPYGEIGGALLGGMLPSAMRRVVTPLPSSPERQVLAGTLRNEGVPVTAGQATGNKPLQWMESALGDTMGAGGSAGRVMENQAEQFTAAALRRAGIDANRATPQVIDDAFARIGGNFEAVGLRNNVVRDQAFTRDLNNTLNEYNNLVSQTNRAPVVMNTARDISASMAANGGQLSGQQYNAFASRLARQARGARADPQLHEALQGLRTALDNAMERTLLRTGNSADMQLLRNARNEYRNMMVLERAATGAGSNAAEGLISPSQLRNAVVQQNRRAYGRGRGDFADLARSGEALLKPLPQSGTSPRQNVTQILQTIGAVVGGSAGTAGGPAGTALGAAAGLAAPAVAGRVLMSRPVQSWLSNQIMPGVNNPDQARREALARLLLSSGSLRSPPALPSQ
jgi:hypothetical protein